MAKDDTNYPRRVLDPTHRKSALLHRFQKPNLKIPTHRSPNKTKESYPRHLKTTTPNDRI